MNVFMLTWKSFGNEDMIDAFQELGHSVTQYPFSDKGERSDEIAVQTLTSAIKDSSADFVFSFNYFPVAAISCKNLSIPYVSWIYDSPYVRMYHYSINYPTNCVFTFDQAQFIEFHNAGIQTVHYLPMAANTKRLKAMQDYAAFRKTKWAPSHEVAFIGSLYTEKHQFFERMDTIKPYTRGYLEGLMAAQKQVYGYNFIQSLLTKDILADMQNSLPMHTGKDSVESLEYLFAQYVINRQLTAVERQDLLSSVAKEFSLDLYTPDTTFCMDGCTNHGPIDYYDMAPYVFKTSKINLNISLRSILSGIPLRCFDIMGAGGFLMTNFQSDFLELFVPGEDFVYYDSKKSLLEQINYYLKNDAERDAIASNGFTKIKQQHTYVHRIAEMLSYLN